MSELIGEPGESLIFESVVTHCRDAVIVTRTDSIDEPAPTIIYVNPAFEEMTGFARAEALGKSPRMLQGPDTSPDARRRIRAALKAWEPIGIEILNYRKDGSEFWVDLSIVPVCDASGWFTHWVSIQRDITARKADEAGAAARTRATEERAAALALEIDRRRQVEARLMYSASHDELTNLRNRSYLIERLHDAIASASHPRAAADADFAVLFIDLDRFKLVNDSLGHSVGDALLQHVAARLTEATRPEDTLARIGGDEFVILLERTTLARAALVASRIIDVLAEPLEMEGHNIVASPSIGIATWHPDHQTPETLMRDADTAMYHAKLAGGNRFSPFALHMHDLAVETLRLQTDLRLAFERDEFSIHYQPVVRVPDDGVYGMEALVRWNHPVRGLVRPSTFVPLAEEIGHIVQLGAWVFERACRAASAWRTEVGDVFSIGVNVSSREILDPGYIAMIRRTLARYGNPERIILEITESVFLLGEDVARPIIAELRGLGIKIALDDFGTGYSSLSYLDRFAIDVLKIDRSFVSGVAEATAKRQIVRTIIALAEALDIDVVAEGVESAAQRDALAAMGCRRMQGFFFSPPLDEAAALAFMAQREPTVPRSRCRSDDRR